MISLKYFMTFLFKYFLLKDSLVINNIKKYMHLNKIIAFLNKSKLLNFKH